MIEYVWVNEYEWVYMNVCIFEYVYMCVCLSVCMSTTNNKYNWSASTNEFNNNNLVAWLALGLLPSPSPPLSLYLCLVFFQLICNFCLSVCLLIPTTATATMAKVFVIGQSFLTPQLAPNFPDGLRFVLCCAVLLMCESLRIFIQYSFESDKNYCSVCVCVYLCCISYFPYAIRVSTIISSQNGTHFTNGCLKVRAQIALLRKWLTWRTVSCGPAWETCPY